MKAEGNEEIDETICEFVSIAKIFRDEGGESSNATIRKDGIWATRNYVEWCLKQEHAVAWNAATKRCDFLQLSKKYRNLFKESWTLRSMIDMIKANKNAEPEATAPPQELTTTRK